MPGLSAEDFYELAPDGEVRRWSRIHWGDKQRGTLKFCVPVEPYRDCPAFAAPPSDYPQAAADRFKVFLGQSSGFQLLAPALAASLRPLLEEDPEISNLCIVLRRAPHPFDPIDDPLRISVELSRDGFLKAIMSIYKPGGVAPEDFDPPDLHYAEELGFSDWSFDSFHRIPERKALKAMRSRWQNLLIDRFAADLRELL